FGPDTFFGDHVGLHRFFAKQFSLSASRGGLQFQEVEYVDGIENPGESFPNIVRWLVRHGYSDADIAGVIGGNVMRALEEVWRR
ncbi:MAG: dipeptidase, partial [Chloroflexota bacterium]|nr:dipeptidase [Chloroflexota bacterium]